MQKSKLQIKVPIWPTKKLGDLFQGRDSERIGKTVKIKKNDYQDSGRYPVVDQGVNPISGYIDDESKLYKWKLPVVIFGDHTRIFKFIDFKFAIGADGTKILQPDKELLVPKYFYYALLNLRIENLGYKRHFSVLRRKNIGLPPLKIQHKIVGRLDTVKQAQELNNKQIALADELFQSLLHEELGFKTKKWETIKIEDILLRIENGYSGPQNTENKGLPITRIETIQNFDLDLNRIKHVDISDSEKEKYKLHHGDILFSHINSEEHIGKVAIFKGQITNLLHGINLLRLKTNSKICNPYYLYYVFQTTAIRKEVLRRARRAVNQSSINQTQLKQIKIPLPPFETQRQIVAKLQAAQDYKNKLLEQKQKLQELFSSCLDKAMKGELVS